MNKEIINQPRAIVHSLLFGLSDTPLSIGATLFISTMKLIPLTLGQCAMVDDEDYSFLTRWEWLALKGRNTYYAIRNSQIRRGVWRQVKMHRVILDTPEDLGVDHQDMNGLNNQKSNIRNCSYSQNRMNTLPYGRSKYKGVSIISTGRNKGLIKASICKDRARIYLGYFKTEESAARAYDAKAKELFGEFAYLNFPV